MSPKEYSFMSNNNEGTLLLSLALRVRDSDGAADPDKAVRVCVPDGALHARGPDGAVGPDEAVCIRGPEAVSVRGSTELSAYAASTEQSARTKPSAYAALM